MITLPARLLLGVVHLPPLPGSPRYAGARITDLIAAARADAEALLAAGFDGYVVENFGDAPFYAGRVPVPVATMMTRIISALPPAPFRVINVLRNDGLTALAIAAATDSQAIRVNVLTGAMVTDQGLIEGEAAELLRARAALAPQVAILADVGVKHATPLSAGFDLAESARETAYRALADALIVTGAASGAAAARADVETVCRAVPDRRVLLGSGTSADDIGDWLKLAHGAIVGTSIKRDTQVQNPIDPARASEFIRNAGG